jgi:serine/threonine protein kinase
MSEVLTSGTRLGPYEIADLIGSGGMGQVYRAVDPRLGRKVAIKTLAGAAADDPDRIQRFEAEARAAGTLDHPNLLVVFDIGREGAVSYIVSELLDGETLRERLTEGPVGERRTVDYAMQIARGLAAAHGRGIVHRDLKPENLFLARDGRVKILDFGVAKLTRPSGEHELTTIAGGLTDPGTVVGTVGYMAPEQIRGLAVDHRADIFTLGIVMHEMLSGQRPFRRETTAETMTAILREDAPELAAGVTPALARIVQRCLEKRCEDRFHSAHDLGLALELVATSTTSAGTAAVTPLPERVPRRTALIYGASAAAMLATGFAGGTWFSGRTPVTGDPSFRRLTFRRGLIRSARLAPDGQTILYGALWDGERCRVHTVRIDSPESRPLDLPDASVLAVSRSGELALSLGSHRDGVVTYGTLARVPLAGGAPRQMLEAVKFADWSPDGSELAVVRMVDGRDRLEYPVGRVLVTSGEGGDRTGLGFPRISPDGRQVAAVQYRAPGALEGRIILVDGDGTLTPLSNDYLNVHGLSWRNGEIWYTAADERPLFRALSAVTPSGAGRTVVRTPGNLTLWDGWPDGRLVIAQTDDRGVVMGRSALEGDERDLSWLDASYAEDVSRDGRQLLFSEYGQGAGSDNGAYIRDMHGSDAIRLGPGRALALSPDGRWALCAPAGRPAPYLELLPTGPGESRRLPENGLRYYAARFLPDGEHIVVSAIEGEQPARVYLLELGGGPPRPLTPAGYSAWAVAPDGSTVAVRGLDRKIRLYPIEGGAPTEVPGIAGSYSLIGWITDGLLITRPNDSDSAPGEIHALDPTTGRQKPWRNILPRDRAGIMALNSFRSTPDGSAHAYTWHRALSSLYLADGLG